MGGTATGGDWNKTGDDADILSGGGTFLAGRVNVSGGGAPGNAGGGGGADGNGGVGAAQLVWMA
jgi:hypothetical protein